MLRRTFWSRSTRLGLAAVALFAASSSVAQAQTTTGPLSVGQLMALLDGGVSEARIRAMLDRECVRWALTDAQRTALREVGATVGLITYIESRRCSVSVPVGDVVTSLAEVVVAGRTTEAGYFQLSTHSFTSGQAENNRELQIRSERPMRAITLRFFLRNGWYTPMGITVRDAATGREFFRVETSRANYEDQAFIEVHGARELVIAPTSTRGDYAMIYASSTVHWMPR